MERRDDGLPSISKVASVVLDQSNTFSALNRGTYQAKTLRSISGQPQL